MNAEGVRERLLQLHPCEEDFTVIFSGKKSKAVHGLYNFERREIIIHNRNFTVDDTLLYTAIHELAHHVMATEYGVRGSRCHTQQFWATFHDLLEKAKRDGVYTVHLDDETQAALNEARRLSRELAELQRRLGRLLIEAAEGCERQGLRAEDFIENEAQISRKTMRRSIAAARLELPVEIGADVQEAILQTRNEEARAAMLRAAGEGKSVAQVKQAGKGPPAKPDEADALAVEKGRLEQTITRLTRRLGEVERRLEDLAAGGGRGPARRAADTGG
jgi:hypothetical protein